MAAINVDGFLGAPTSELTISSGQITVTGRFHTIAAQAGTVGTLQTIALSGGAGTQLNGNLPDLYLRPKAGHYIAVQHAIPGTDPIYMLGSQTVNLTDTTALHFIRNFGDNSWLGENGIKLSGGVLVDLTSVQTLTNKSLTAPTLTTPEVVGSLTHRGIVAGYNGAAHVSGQVGTNVVGVNTGTAVSITLSEGQSMSVKASVIAALTDHSQAIVSEMTGAFRRVAAGNIIMIGTTTPITIGTSALAISMGADTTAQAANILATGIAGTSNFLVNYEYTRLTGA